MSLLYSEAKSWLVRSKLAPKYGMTYYLIYQKWSQNGHHSWGNMFQNWKIFVNLIFWQNFQVFLVYSSVYYWYRLNRTKSLKFAVFSMKIFMMIHIIHLWATPKLLQYIHEICGNMPPPQTPKKGFFSQIAPIISSIFLTCLSHNLI